MNLDWGVWLVRRGCGQRGRGCVDTLEDDPGDDLGVLGGDAGRLTGTSTSGVHVPEAGVAGSALLRAGETSLV